MSENTEETKEVLPVVYHIKGKLAEYPDGTLEKTKMFDFLEVPLDDYSDLTFTQEEMRRIRMHAMKMKTGAQAMAPCLCLGPIKCPFGIRCPIADRSFTHSGGLVDMTKQDPTKFPIGRQCLFESEYINSQRRAYMEEYDVDLDSPTEMAQANRLAMLDLYEYRLMLVMSHGDQNGEGVDLMKMQAAGATKDGTILEKMEAHPAWEIMEKIHRQREDILRSLVGTRREKYKKEAALKESDNKDLSTVSADLHARLISIQNGVKRVEEQVIPDAQFTEKPKE